MVNHRYVFLIPVVGMLVSSCTDQYARTRFKIPDELPLFQIVVDVDSVFERARDRGQPLKDGLEGLKSAHSNRTSRSESVSPGVGLMVPITEDGFCLTVAHVIDKGHAFVLVDLEEQGGVFLVGANNDRPIVSTVRSERNGLGAFTLRETKERAIEVIPNHLTWNEFQLVRSEVGHLDSVFLIPLLTIKVWGEDDLALVKIPFQVSSCFPLAQEEVGIGEFVMFFGNPAVHEGAINHVVKRVAADLRQSGSSDFYTLATKQLELLRGDLRKGDSGGPVVNQDGELVGIHRGWGDDESGQTYDLSIGIRPDLINDAIRDWRSKENK